MGAWTPQSQKHDYYPDPLEARYKLIIIEGQIFQKGFNLHTYSLYCA